jgi:hypothetical protein
MELGPRLAEKKGHLFKKYLEIIADRYERALAGMKASKSDAAAKKALETEEKLAGIRRIAGCL